jgi:xylan 1,4-beta-xylosidase
VHLTAQGIPATVRRVLLEEYRIDATHSNAYAVWKQMGSPLEPTADQITQLKAAGQLQLIGSPRWLTVNNGAVEIHLDPPRESVSLVRVSWNSAASR